MADPKHTPLPKSRTYARDLEQQRTKHGLPPEAVLPTATKKIGRPLPMVVRPSISVLPQAGVPLPQINSKITTVGVSHAPLIESVLKTHQDDKVRVASTTPTVIPTLNSLGNHAHTTPHQSLNKGSEIKILADESAATIITDTKSTHFNVTTSVFQSLKDWWHNEMKKRRQKKVPKYVIPDSDRRKGIIQMATSQTARDATADHESIRDQVRLRDAETTIKEISTVWTPNTEPGWPLLEEKTASQTFIPPALLIPVPVTPPPEINSTLTPAPLPLTEPVDDGAARWGQTPALPDSLIAEESSEASWTSDKLENTEPVNRKSELDFSSVSATSPTSISKNSLRPQEQGIRFFSLANTTALTVSVVMAAVIIIVTILTLRYFLTPLPAAQTVSASGVLMDIPAYTDTRVAVSKLDFESLILGYRDSEPGTKEVFFATSTPLNSPSSLLTLIDPQIDPNLSQSVTTVVFGWYQKSKPFIVLRVSDRTTAFGGMLKWEKSMPDTLRNVFSIPVREDNSFIDHGVSGTDVRVLTNGSDQEYIVYGFINSQTIIITTDRVTYTAISTLLIPSN